MKKSIYRYRGTNNYSLYEVINQEFYFSSPYEFNDPFDCKNLFSLENSSNKDWKVFFEKLFIQNRPELSQHERTKLINEILKSGAQYDKQALNAQWEAWDHALSEIVKKLGIICFSEKNNDILMWSHYSDSHRGFCLQFDPENLAKSFYVGKVKYSNKYPTLKEFANANATGMSNLMLLSKSSHWKYEKEIRLILDTENDQKTPGNRIYKYPPEALTGVIFGLQMQEKDKETIRNILKDRNAEISYFQATKSKNSYSLKINKA